MVGALVFHGFWLLLLLALRLVANSTSGTTGVTLPLAPRVPVAIINLNMRIGYFEAGLGIDACVKPA